MITNGDYFGSKPHTEAQEDAAQELLDRVNALIDEAESEGVHVRQNCPNTGTEISGSKGGSGDGGFRLPTATTGAARSSHKVLPEEAPEGAGVDVYDPANALDDWITSKNLDTAGTSNSVLEKHGLYREHPHDTPHWCHLTTRPVSTGVRTFNP
ncbi:hypothetical protein UFOVP1040_32 [uncultured Caudovirales phage]|uniref:Uncharacterized protein n=1 Tax=uncultured Caudovirales phage TaxID=2100421 RepID=A0A6J5QCQ6_9CAUD|nr:hypothetical protein UFOVP1040_32 [uncultured Caudovirales phage]